MVEPVDPFKHRVFDSVKISPRTTAMKDLRLKQANDGCGARNLTKLRVKGRYLSYIDH